MQLHDLSARPALSKFQSHVRDGETGFQRFLEAIKLSHDLRPKWSMDEKGRLVIKGSVRGHLQIGKGAWGYVDVYGEREAKIVLSVIEKGNYAARSRNARGKKGK